mmetsp:Transcript_11270/g.15456  ORF Transcript_11270/g.15456 Transcript_11270/m.15456 type:complete len:95 (-) Transcript_11270:1601-1885(-)
MHGKDKRDVADLVEAVESELLWLDLEALLELLSVRLEVDEVAEADGSFAGYGRTTPAAVLAIGPKDESPCCNIEEMSPMPGFEVMPRLERADAQ